jgi:hypothetical protein
MYLPYLFMAQTSSRRRRARAKRGGAGERGRGTKRGGEMRVDPYIGR